MSEMVLYRSKCSINYMLLIISDRPKCGIEGCYIDNRPKLLIWLLLIDRCPIARLTILRPLLLRCKLYIWRIDNLICLSWRKRMRSSHMRSAPFVLTCMSVSHTDY